MLCGGCRVFAHADRKGYRYVVKTGSDKKKKPLNITVCLKIYVGLGEKIKRVEKVLKKE